MPDLTPFYVTPFYDPVLRFKTFSIFETGTAAPLLMTENRNHGEQGHHTKAKFHAVQGIRIPVEEAGIASVVDNPNLSISPAPFSSGAYPTARLSSRSLL
jgi:hypothetical protein